jgi:hypothetical protein
MWGWPLRSSYWGPPPPSWRGSGGARTAMEVAVLSPKLEEWLWRCVHELVNNQMEASFVLRWVKKGIKIQEQCIREVRKHYHCLWILRHWARVATTVMSTSLVIGGSCCLPTGEAYWHGALACRRWLAACTLLSRGSHVVQHWGAGAVMRNISTEEEKYTVGNVLCKQLYQTRECNFLQNFVNTGGSDV